MAIKFGLVMLTRSLWAALVLMLSAGVTQGDAATDEVVLGAYEYPPFVGAELPGQGVLTELTVRVFREAGYRPRIVYMPFARLLSASRNGKVDALIGLWHTPEREQWFTFTEPLLSTPLGFYQRQGAGISFSDLSELAPLTIGSPRAYALPPGFEQAGLNLLYLHEDEQALRMLHNGRIDLALISKDLGNYLFRTRLDGYDKALAFIEPPLSLQWFYTGISKQREDYQKLRDDFNHALKQLTEQGAVQQIINKHGF